jgi:hypothetical protein
MKLPEYMTKESTHKTPGVNTMSLTGLSVLWGVMLNLISPWWMIASVLLILSGFGNEINKRKNG